MTAAMRSTPRPASTGSSSCTSILVFFPCHVESWKASQIPRKMWAIIERLDRQFNPERHDEGPNAGSLLTGV